MLTMTGGNGFEDGGGRASTRPAAHRLGEASAGAHAAFRCYGL